MLAGGQSFLTILTGENAPRLDGLVAALERVTPTSRSRSTRAGSRTTRCSLVAQ